jgi:hypothetical protein
MSTCISTTGAPKRIGFISTRFHGTDGVTLEARKWAEHIGPPRDLQSWRQLSVSAIANFAPVILRKLDMTTVRETLDRKNEKSAKPAMV